MHNRRTRPTLRVLREDLTAGWDTPHAQRALARGDFAALHPLSELDHPIVRKAAEWIGSGESADQHKGRVRSSKSLLLLEIRAEQWRGGVWRDDETGVHWLVVAGLAKGEHGDHDDFYEIVNRAED